MSRPPFPPFDIESAIRKQAYTVDSQWRNRVEFIHGRDEIVASLIRK